MERNERRSSRERKSVATGLFNEWHFRRDVVFGRDELLGDGRRRRRDNALTRAQHDFALGELAELARELGVQEEAETQDTQFFGRLDTNRDGHRHDLKETRGGILKGGPFVPRGSGVRSERSEHAPLAVADHHDVGTDPFPVFGRNGQYSRRVAGGNGRFQLGQIGNQPSHTRQGLGTRGVVVTQKLRGLLETTLKVGFGLGRDADGDEVRPDCDREHRNESAGEKHSILERRKRFHQSSLHDEVQGHRSTGADRNGP